MNDSVNDGSGNITSLNINGRKWTVTYPGSDLATITGSSGRPITFTANTGVITGNKSAAGANTYKYDGNGRLTGDRTGVMTERDRTTVQGVAGTRIRTPVPDRGVGRSGSRHCFPSSSPRGW